MKEGYTIHQSFTPTKTTTHIIQDNFHRQNKVVNYCVTDWVDLFLNEFTVSIFKIKHKQ